MEPEGLHAQHHIAAACHRRYGGDDPNDDEAHDIHVLPGGSKHAR